MQQGVGNRLHKMGQVGSRKCIGPAKVGDCLHRTRGNLEIAAGFNAGGGSYLPRQGSFVIQPNNTFFGLTGPGVVKSVLGEDRAPLI